MGTLFSSAVLNAGLRIIENGDPIPAETVQQMPTEIIDLSGAYFGNMPNGHCTGNGNCTGNNASCHGNGACK